MYTRQRGDRRIEYYNNIKYRKKRRAADIYIDGRGRVTLRRRWTTCADERYRNAYNII